MITVITGCMFSGKTTELIKRIRCAEIAKQRTLVLKPTADTRSELEIVTHSGLHWAADQAPTSLYLPDLISRAGSLDYDVLGIDEAQFLGETWVESLDLLASLGVEVLVACLNQTFEGKPFGIAPKLLAIADNIVPLRAVCMSCLTKDSATKTFRISASKNEIEIGGADKYQSLCRVCWESKMKSANALRPNISTR